MKLTKGATTENVALSLKEKTTIAEPIYLFEFQSDQTKTSNTCICQDVSIFGAARNRSNLFNITEGVDDRLNSSLILFNEGRYNYIVREQESPTNLDPELSGAIVQRGIMVLLASPESSNFIEHDLTIQYVVNEP
jgi:hypothetical protein